MKKSTKKSKKCNLKIEFTKKPMTAYGGFYILGKLFEKINLKDNLERIFPAEEKSNNGKGIYSKLLTFALTVIAGGKRYAHTMYLGESREVYQKIFNVPKMVKSYSAITRLFDKIDSWFKVEQLSEGLWDYFFNLIIKDTKMSDWLTFDSTVITRYGNQEGAKKGYNPKKKGRPSHHPLLAFLNIHEYVVNYWNRAGNATSGENVIDFAKQTLERIKDRINIKGIIADTGFYGVKLFDLLELMNLQYIVGVPLLQILQKKARKLTKWKKIEDGLEVGEFYFCHSDEKWTKERRYIVIRRDITKIDNAQGKQLELFKEDDSVKNFRYSIYITNMDLAPEEIWRQYRLRADDENIIKEDKYDFALEGFCKDNFWGTEAAMLFRIFFYNIINLLRKDLLSKKESNVTLHTLRFKYFTIPAVLGKNSRQFVLRLGVKAQKIKSKFKYAASRIEKGFHPNL